jgi:class 3 adenylate cyclase/tetratricopeptide (TPR) repeat protein
MAPAGCASCGEAYEPDQRFCGHCGWSLGPEPVAARLQPSADDSDVEAGRVTSPPEAVQERKLATVLFADVVGFTSLAERTDPEIVARMVDAAFRQLGAVVAEHGGTIDKYMGDSLMAVFGVPIAHDDDAERAVAAGLAMRKLGGDLVFSIGINSGEVMATDIGRSGDATVIGDTVNVAARFEKAAGPGEVLCGALTAELARSGVVFRPRQPVILKGKREPVEVWEAVALRRRGEDATAEELPLIGRADELAYLEAIWNRVARHRQTEVVVLCGDAGSGKSRLAGELARLMAPTGKVVRTAYPAYGPIGGGQMAADVLEQLGPIDDLDVESRAWSLAGRTDDSLRSIDPAGLEKEQLWGFVRLLEVKTEERPLALILDDMHRVADTSLAILSELAARMGSRPLLMVLVGRSEPSSWLLRFPAATTVRLAPLADTDAAQLAAALVCDKPLAVEASDFLVERAGGNPLYLRELVRVARAQGSLVDDGERYQLGSAAAVPATLQALLAARLDALSPGLKRVFQHIAVLGNGTTAAQVAELGTPSPDAALRGLVDAGLLRTGPDGGYIAADPLLREVAYETLPRHARGELHRRAAALVGRPEDRARHLDRAAKYLEEDESVAFEAAETLAQVGMDFFEESRLPDATRLLERAVALGCRRPSALLALATLHDSRSDWEAARRVLALVADDPDDPVIALERDHGIARTQLFSDPARAVAALADIVSRWHALGDRKHEAWAIGNAGVANFNLSRMEEASDYLSRSLAMFEELGDRNGEVAVSSFLCLARPTDRRVPGWLNSALAFADEAGDRGKQLTALSPLAWHHFLRSLWGGPGDTAEAERSALRLAETAEELGAHDMAVHGRSLLALIARYGGRIQAAASQVARLGRVLRPQDREMWVGWAASFVVAVAAGTTEAAPPFPPQDSVDPVASVSGMMICTELVLAGRIDEAVSRLEDGPPNLFNPIGDTLGVLGALTLVLCRQPDQARPWAERALRSATALEARATATAAAALLAEIDGDPTALPPMPAVASSVAELIVLRAHAVLGDISALEPLRRAVVTLAAPGLLAGVPVAGA